MMVGFLAKALWGISPLQLQMQNGSGSNLGFGSASDDFDCMVFDSVSTYNRLDGFNFKKQVY